MKYKIYKINENTYKILTNTYSYTFTIDRINKLYCKQYVKQQKYDIDKLYMGEYLTKQQKYQAYSSLDNWYKHCSHSMINVEKQNLITNEITQIDITNAGDPINDVIRTKFIEKWKEGYFDKNTNDTYEAKGKKIDAYNDALNINLYKIKKRPEDEL